MIKLEVSKQLLLTTLSNEIFDLDDIIKRRAKGEEVEPWVSDLIKRRDELISIRNSIEKSVSNHVTMQIQDSIIL